MPWLRLTALDSYFGLAKDSITSLLRVDLCRLLGISGLSLFEVLDVGGRAAGIFNQPKVVKGSAFEGEGMSVTSEVSISDAVDQPLLLSILCDIIHQSAADYL